MIGKLKNNKAFTFIELTVVISILGIIVLLAVPECLDYVEQAKITQIQNDVRTLENIIEL